MASNQQPSLHTIVELCILLVTATGQLFLLYRLICWMLIEYDLLGDGEVVVTNLWVMSSICACVVLCVATFIQSDKEATQEEVKKDSEQEDKSNQDS